MIISNFLERIPMEDIDMKNSLNSKLQVYSICSIRIRSRKKDIFEKPSLQTRNFRALAGETNNESQSRQTSRAVSRAYQRDRLNGLGETGQETNEQN